MKDSNMGISADSLKKVLLHLDAIRDSPERFVESDDYGRFYKAVYDAGLILEFDWMEWTGQAQEYVNRPELIESADIESICKLMTTHLRNDRFCDGHLGSMIENGHMTTLLRRLKVLAAAMDQGDAPRLRVCIHRGAHQIGGTCIELECQGKRLVLDVGVPLDAVDPETVEMPNVAGFNGEDPSLLGIAISHPHQDHYGLASRVPKSTTFLMGAATERILAAAAVFTPSGGTFENVIHFTDREAIELGPFRITPYLMDHSAYDAYAFLVEAGGKKLFYTGDLRGHGRKAKLFERLLTSPPKKVDTLLMEGTTITRTGTSEGFVTESDLESEITKLFSSTPGMPLVWCSGQNIDRLVTVFRAAKRSGRQLILDMYTAHILAATENPRLPQADWAETRVYLPWSQKQRIIKDEAFEIANHYKPDRIYPEQLAGAAAKSVMLFRPSMRIDLEKAECLTGACIIYSMWDGYLKDPKLKPFLAWLDKCEVPLHQIHTSGHASVKDLRRLRQAFSDAVVVPIHTQQPDLYEKTFGNVQVHDDGEWWELGYGHKQMSEQVVPTNDNNELASRLRAAVRPTPNNVKLPGAINFIVDQSTVRLEMGEECVRANMQESISSFEGWALALRRWLPEVKHIELTWEYGGDIFEPHYQRFLYRAGQFASLFPSWFSLPAPDSESRLAGLKTASPGDYVVTAPKKDRNTAPKYKCTEIADAINNEHKLECFIKDNPMQLSSMLRLSMLDRQFPVGLFKGCVNKRNEIFPRGHSAIDLWGVNGDELFIFELKARGNTPMGILSELFFYSYIMEGMQRDLYKPEKPIDDLAPTKCVRAYILAPKWHVLIDEQLLQMANDAFRTNDRKIRFGTIRIQPQSSEAFALELEACD